MTDEQEFEFPTEKAAELTRLLGTTQPITCSRTALRMVPDLMEQVTAKAYETDQGLVVPIEAFSQLNTLLFALVVDAGNREEKEQMQ